MIHLDELIRQLAENAKAISALVRAVSEDQAAWKPDPDTWSMSQVMDHLYKEELNDFRCHLQEMLSSPPQAWGSLQSAPAVVDHWRQSVDYFLREREQSIAWLKGLQAPDWQAASVTPFGPEGEKIVLRAGDVLASWLAHDFLHLRQLIELQYAWCSRQALPYSLQYAGEW
jgi:hypothetical protein